MILFKYCYLCEYNVITLYTIITHKIKYYKLIQRLRTGKITTKRSFKNCLSSEILLNDSHSLLFTLILTEIYTAFIQISLVCPNFAEACLDLFNLSFATTILVLTEAIWLTVDLPWWRRTSWNGKGLFEGFVLTRLVELTDKFLHWQIITIFYNFF